MSYQEYAPIDSVESQSFESSSPVYHVTNLTDFNLRLGTSTSPVLVKFTAEWCGPCKKIEPVFVDLVNVFNVKLLEVDVDKCVDVSEAYSISSMPTFIMFKNGTAVDSMKGADNKGLVMLVRKHCALLNKI
jgi:thioredoxin 1